MDVVQEFLESSTIHGLVYIANTKKLVKLVWLGVVMAGFTVAGFLIHQSFSSWATSPITTRFSHFMSCASLLGRRIVCH